MNILIAHENHMMRSLRQTHVEEVLQGCRIDHATSTRELIDKALNGGDYSLVVAGGEIVQTDNFEPVRVLRRAGFKDKIWVYHTEKVYRKTAANAGADRFYDNTKISDDDRFKRDLAKL